NADLADALGRAEGARAAAAAQRDRAAKARAEAEKQKAEADRLRGVAEEAHDLARRYLYAADLSMGARAWDDANCKRGAALLERQSPRQTGGKDLRGFEWHYLDRLLHSELRVLRGHTHAVRSLAWSRDRKTLASGGIEGRVRFWDANDGRCL